MNHWIKIEKTNYIQCKEAPDFYGPSNAIVIPDLSSRSGFESTGEKFKDCGQTIV